MPFPVKELPTPTLIPAGAFQVNVSTRVTS